MLEMGTHLHKVSRNMSSPQTHVFFSSVTSDFRWLILLAKELRMNARTEDFEVTLACTSCHWVQQESIHTYKIATSSIISHPHCANATVF